MIPNAKPLAMPKLALWLFERGLVAADLVEPLEKSSESIRRYCLPFGHADRRIPDEETLTKIFQLTDGEVNPLDFYPEHLRGEKETSQ